MCDRLGKVPLSISIQHAGAPHGMIGRLFAQEMHRVDPKTIDGVREQLVVLVKQLLGANAAFPNPFPVEQQLSDLGVSSLKMVNLMLAVELEFDIAIPQSDITPENFHSVAAIQSLVVRTLSLRKSVT
jgi:acyl carrier protein